MDKIKLKVTPSLARTLEASSTDWLTIERETGEGTTIGDLLTTLTTNYTEFGNVVINPDNGQLSDQIMVIFNDKLLPYSAVLETKLNDGDRIILIPVYSGG